MAWPKGDRKCIKRDGYSDQSRDIFGNLLAAAAVASAAYNSAKAVSIAIDEWNLAKKYWRIAENWLDHYRDNYAPVEDMEVAEAHALTDPSPEYVVARGRSRAATWVKFRDLARQAVRCTTRYCTGLRQDMLTDVYAAQASAVAMSDALGYRNERAYIAARSDQRFEKQFNTAKRGRDIVADNASLGKATAGIYGNMFEQAWAGLEGAGQYLGYWGARHQTAYPQVYARATGQNSGKVVNQGQTKVTYQSLGHMALNTALAVAED